MPLVQVDAVVVAELFAEGDRAARLDVDPPLLLDRLAVRIARVVDPPGRIPALPGVDHDVVVELEQEGVGRALAVVGVQLVREPIGDATALVLDDAHALGDRPRREHAAAVDLRASYDVERLAFGRLPRVDSVAIYPFFVDLRSLSARHDFDFHLEPADSRRSDPLAA